MKIKVLSSTLLALIIIFTSSCKDSVTIEHTPPSKQSVGINSVPDVGINEMGLMFYTGAINYKGYELLQKLYADNKDKIANPTLLLIESNGGDAFYGLMIGNFIKDKNLSIKIPNLCLSACANYIFPAAKFKYLGKNALIGFHEMLLSGTDITEEEIKSKTKTNHNRLKININDFKTDTSHLPTECIAHPELVSTPAQKEQIMQNTIKTCYHYIISQTTSFYNKLNVNSKLLDIGKPKLRQAIKESNNVIRFFYYDSASLKTLGVKNVVYPYNWAPEDNPYYKHMFEIKLSDWQ